MTTLASATLEVAKLVGDVISGTGTGGSTTTLEDTNFTRNAPPDNAFNKGTIWFTSGDNDGLSAIVTDWDQAATPTFTFAAPSTSTASGAEYSFCDRDFPRDKLRECVNSALMHDIPNGIAYDITTLTVPDQEDYTLPTDVYNIKSVEVYGKLTGTDLVPVPDSHWREIDGSIRFLNGAQPRKTDYIIRLGYVVPPAELTTDAGAISDYIHVNYLAWKAAVRALRWRFAQGRGDREFLKEQIVEALQQADAMERQHKHMIPKVPLVAKASGWAVGGSSDPDDDITKVRV